jgi:hypothetical protein
MLLVVGVMDRERAYIGHDNRFMFAGDSLHSCLNADCFAQSCSRMTREEEACQWPHALLRQQPPHLRRKAYHQLQLSQHIGMQKITLLQASASVMCSSMLLALWCGAGARS